MEQTSKVKPWGESFSLEIPKGRKSNYLAEHEPFTRAIFASSALGCDVVLDIGAQIGFFSLVAMQTNPSLEVISVEASPDNFEILSRNLNVHIAEGRAKAVFGAFGSSTANRNFYLTEASDNSGLTGHPLTNTMRKVAVPVLNADSLGIRPGAKILAKVDVEGHEIEVIEELFRIRGNSSELRLLVELNPKTIRHAGHNLRTLIELVLEGGYRVFLLHEEENEFVEIQSPKDQELEDIGQSYKNLYCLPKKSASCIAAFLHASGAGGAENSHVEVSRDLLSLGNMVRTFLPIGESGFLEKLRAAGSAAVHCPSGAQWWAKDAGNETQPPRLDVLNHSAVEWVRRIKWDEIDFVLTQSSVISIGALVASYSQKPHVWWIREFGDLDQNLRYPLPTREMGEAFKSLSQQILVNSDAVKHHFFDGSDDKVMKITPCPARLVAESRPKPTRPHISLVAALNPNKGGEVFLHAISELRSSGLNFTASLRGPGGQMRVAELQSLADSLGLGSVVKIQNNLRKPNEIYTDVNIAVVASKSEAFGRVPFEATNFDCAVVYSRSGGIPEYMTDGETGLSFAPEDHLELASKLRILLEDPSLIKLLVNRAKEDLLSNERHFKVLDQLRAVFSVERHCQKPTLTQQVLAWNIPNRDSLLTERDSLLTERDSLLTERDSLLTERDSLRNSFSWKITKPFRIVWDALMNQGN